jgi:hypothetical protein
MSRARHKEHEKHHERAKGGRVGMVVSGNPDVLEEAHEEHKKGGRVKKHHRKHGGKVHEMHAEGHKAHHRMDRPKRARGGKVRGSDQMPFSSAHKSGKAGDMAGGEPD